MLPEVGARPSRLPSLVDVVMAGSGRVALVRRLRAEVDGDTVETGRVVRYRTAGDHFTDRRLHDEWQTRSKARGPSPAPHPDRSSRASVSPCSTTPVGTNPSRS